MTTTYLSGSGTKYTINDTDEIHRGGEGRIMALKTPEIVAKLYHQGITPLTKSQFQFLSKLNKALFVTPIELLSDASGEIKGFTMEYVTSEYFPLSSFFSKNFCTKNGISEKIKKTTITELIKALTYVHKQGVVIGDLNQYNILVNKVGSIKLIDTDSYQTTAHKHSAILLDDIRDYLHGGRVSAESDFFALSVIIFYALTHVHPFKGIHPTYKNISDRMIQHLPVFAENEGIKIPKIYRPLASKNLFSQFKELYIKGNRFLISISGVGQIMGIQKPIKATTFKEKDLKVTATLPETSVIDIQFNSNLGYIETNENHFVYDTKNKGYLSLKYTISKKQYHNVFIGNKNVIVANNESIFHYKNDAEIIKVKNFELPKHSHIHNFEDVLVVFTENLMYKVFLDDIISSSVRNTRNEVFGQSFTHNSGLLQNTGGLKRTFYKAGKDIASVKLNFPVKEIKTQGNVACIRYINKSQVETKYLFFNGLKTIAAPTSCELLTDFAYMPTGEHGYIFEPADDAIKVIRTQDFQTVSLLECPQVSSLSKLQYTTAGIIALEDERVFLLNQK